MAIKHSITLSTTEPNNEVGIIKIRQADEQTQMLDVQITENGVPKSYQGLAVYFCAKLGQTAGLGIIEQKLKLEEMTNPANGKLEYTMRAEDWQILGRQKGYFSFRKMKDEHEFIEQFTTRDFTFDVIKSVYSDGIKEVKKDGSTYVWTIEELIRLFKEYMASGKSDWEEFVEQNREIIESVDPGGKLIGELIDARRPFGGDAYPTLGERLDEDKAEVSAQLQQKASKVSLERKINERIVNFSVDDFQHALNDITVNSATYTSIFDNGTFAHLKHLHDTYGAKFSLFVFTNDQYNLSNTTTKFASEFSEHCDWLQFGFHGRDPQTLYHQTTLEEFKSDYDNFLFALNIFAPDNLCRHIRLSSFYGTSSVMNELRTIYGIKGVFTADDDRLSYDLTTEEAKQIKVDGVLRKNYLNYIESTFRLDNFTATNVRGNLEQVKHRNAISVYLHDTNFNVKKDMLTEAVKWLVSNGYHFSSFDDIRDIRHYKPLLNYIPYSLSTNWSLRTGNTFKVRKDGNKVHVQGQLIKNGDITPFEQCVSFDSSLAPEYPMVIDVKNFQDSGTSIETIVGVLDGSSQLKVGWRNKNALPDNRVVSFDFSYYLT